MRKLEHRSLPFNKRLYLLQQNQCNYRILHILHSICIFEHIFTNCMKHTSILIIINNLLQRCGIMHIQKNLITHCDNLKTFWLDDYWNLVQYHLLKRAILWDSSKFECRDAGLEVAKTFATILVYPRIEIIYGCRVGTCSTLSSDPEKSPSSGSVSLSGWALCR